MRAWSAWSRTALALLCRYGEEDARQLDKLHAAWTAAENKAVAKPKRFSKATAAQLLSPTEAALVLRCFYNNVALTACVIIVILFSSIIRNTQRVQYY